MQTSGRPTQAGIDISNNTAMTYSAVFNAVVIIAGTVASLPLILYRRIDEHNKERYVDHPLYDVLHNLANPEMTSYVWREISQGHLLFRGNAYSEIIRDRVGRTVELWPLNPAKVDVKRDENDKIIYELSLSSGKKEIYPAEKILHIPGLGYDGRIGYSVLTLARESLGLGIAMETFQSRFYGAGTNIGAIFEHPNILGKEAHDSLVDDLTKKYAGLFNSQRAIVLEEGMQYKKTGMPLEDAQFLESRTFQVAEIARWFNLPPHKLKDLSRATFSNIEEMQLEFIIDSIRPWLVRWEQHIMWKLLSRDERKRYFAEFLIEGLLRGNAESRSKMLSAMRQNGAISANDWRRIENMNPLKGRAGTAIWMPLAMADANAPLEEKPPKDKVEPKEPGEKKLENFELRSLRSIKNRRRLAEAFKPIFRNMAKEILAKECPGIRRIAKKTLQTRETGDFIFEIDKFYKAQKKYIRDKFAGVFAGYGSAIYPVAADEVNAPEDIPDEFNAYTDEFAEHSSNRYVESSRGQLKQVALKHREDDPADAINQRLDEWEEKRPDKVANREVVDGECGFAQYVYYAAGFKTVWVTLDESCPYCMSLNGRVISRGMHFMNAGQSFQPEGAENPLIVTQNISHPQLHLGCDCTIRSSV